MLWTRNKTETGVEYVEQGGKFRIERLEGKKVFKLYRQFSEGKREQLAHGTLVLCQKRAQEVANPATACPHCTAFIAASDERCGGCGYVPINESLCLTCGEPVKLDEPLKTHEEVICEPCMTEIEKPKSAPVAQRKTFIYSRGVILAS